MAKRWSEAMLTEKQRRKKSDNQEKESMDKIMLTREVAEGSRRGCFNAMKMAGIGIGRGGAMKRSILMFLVVFALLLVGSYARAVEVECKLLYGSRSQEVPGYPYEDRDVLLRSRTTYYTAFIMTYKNKGNEAKHVWDDYTLVYETADGTRRQLDTRSATLLKGQICRKFDIPVVDEGFVGEIYPGVVKYRVVIFNQMPQDTVKFDLHVKGLPGEFVPSETKKYSWYKGKDGAWQAGELAEGERGQGEEATDDILRRWQREAEKKRYGR